MDTFFLGGVDEAGNPSDKVVRYLAVHNRVADDCKLEIGYKCLDKT